MVLPTQQFNQSIPFIILITDDENGKKSTVIQRGSKIGKMQLMRSGKVVLILTDGRRFEVN